MNSFDIVIKKHSNQHYTTFFNKKTGFFIRCEDQGYEEPFWAMAGPEILDISITNWCDKNCSICYRNSNQNDSHMKLEKYEKIISESSNLGVLQVALGGGNPNQHPQFIQILELTREKYGIIPSYTTNGRGLTEEIIEATIKYCGAVAVSAYTPFKEMKEAIQKLTQKQIKTNIHFVLTSKSIELAINWLKNQPDFLNEINALVFLNYKPVGKNIDYSLLLNKSDKLEEFFRLIDNQYPFKIGFDSCSVSGLIKNVYINSNFIEPCESARFSAFISEDLKMYPCSFSIEIVKGEYLENKSMKEIWVNSDCFVQFREKLKTNECSKHNCFKDCLGGCPLFEQIKLCEN
jgi:MoaA/NifB/PqqE/SkfB family radical SAM enzyme